MTKVLCTMATAFKFAQSLRLSNRSSCVLTTHLSRLNAAVVFVNAFVCGQCLHMLGLVKPRAHRFGQVGMVLFEREHVVGFGLGDVLGDTFLAAHRINADDRAAQLELIQDLWNGGDFIGLFFNLETANTIFQDLTESAKKLLHSAQN
jgi:hypothetical protein